MTNQPQCVRCGKPLADGALVCRQEGQQLAQALTAAAGHAEDAWTVIARQTRYGTAGGVRAPEVEPAAATADLRRNRVTEFGWTASIEQPAAGGLRAGTIPPDLTASASLDDVGSVVTTWARHVCETRTVELPARRPLLGPLCDQGFECQHPSCSGVRFRRPPSAMAEAFAWLATQAEWLRHRPEAAEAFDELHDTCARLGQLVDRPPSGDRLVGMCDCGRILYAPHGRDVVQCKPCGAKWNVTESQEILFRHLDGRLLTAAEAARMAAYLDPGRTTEQIRMLIASWAKRGQVAVHGRVLREPTDAELSADPAAGPVQVPTYLFGEVRARLADTPRRNREGAAA